MRLTRSVAPSGVPVTLEAAKLFCRVDSDEHDATITELVDAATNYLDGPDGILGRAILTQTWLLELTEWPTSLGLPIEPVTGVLVTYFDAGGVEQTLTAENYELINQPGAKTELCWVSGAVLPALDNVEFPVRLTITAGFGDADAVPSPIKVAIKMLAANWFETPESVVVGSSATKLPRGVDALLARWRVLV